MREEQRDNLDGLESFAAECDFSKGCLVLDLDGTALLEHQGKVIISKAVEEGVRAIYRLQRPVILNTLRFPISVLNTVGEAWYEMANIPILTVLLNGSMIGYIIREENRLAYQELISFPLNAGEIEKILEGVRHLMEDGVEDLLFFFYSRQWEEGESLWTPHSERIESLRKRYVSAKWVFGGTLERLREELLKREICMACLFIDRPADTLMAYQHSRRNNFFTGPGVDKASGLRAVAEKLGISLEDSLGAGDTEMDTFLAEVGLATIVGSGHLPFRGKRQTLRVPGPDELGTLITRFASVLRRRG